MIKAQKVAGLLTENPGMSVGEAMRETGYALTTSLKPSNLTKSKAWSELLDEYLPQNEILDTHKALLRASNLDHMTFPLGPKTQLEIESWHAERETAALKLKKPYIRGETISDEDITAILAEKNCTVRKIVHGEQARHVYFWSADNRARKDALDMAYKLRGTYAAEKHLHVQFSLVGLGSERDQAQQLLAPGTGTGPQLGEIEA